MNAAHRLLVLVTGMPNSMETPQHRARLHCSGCEQGCDLCDAEFNRDVAPDADRVIQPPLPIEVDPAYRAKVMRWAAALGLSFWLAMAGLLRLFGARSFG